MKNALYYLMTSFITMTPHELILFCRHRTGYTYCCIMTVCPNGPSSSTSCSVPCISSLWVVPPSKSGTWKSASVCRSLSPTHHRMCSITKLSGLSSLNRSPPPHCYYLTLRSCYLTMDNSNILNSLFASHQSSSSTFTTSRHPYFRKNF